MEGPKYRSWYEKERYRRHHGGRDPVFPQWVPEHEYQPLHLVLPKLQFPENAHSSHVPTAPVSSSGSYTSGSILGKKVTQTSPIGIIALELLYFYAEPHPEPISRSDCRVFRIHWMVCAYLWNSVWHKGSQIHIEACSRGCAHMPFLLCNFVFRKLYVATLGHYHYSFYPNVQSVEYTIANTSS